MLKYDSQALRAIFYLHKVLALTKDPFFLCTIILSLVSLLKELHIHHVIAEKRICMLVKYHRIPFIRMSLQR